MTKTLSESLPVAEFSTNGPQSNHARVTPALARGLVERAFASFDTKYGFSTASCQVYDTAWVAMVKKRTGDDEIWLYPECFHYLLRTQSSDGSWGTDPVSQTAGILDTAAALLAILKHAAKPLQIHDYSSSDLDSRISLAIQALDRQLNAWNDLVSTNHIGVELIVPALLDYLRGEDCRLQFKFQGQDALKRMYQEKSSRFRPEMLYSTRPSSAVHSLEAFVGRIDFDKVSHHLYNGSMMASPSSTAAYLIHSTTWDSEAEAYLRHVIGSGMGHGDGGVSGTFPIHYFEFNWTVATLLHAGYKVSDLGPIVNDIARVIRNGFAEDGGIIGFEPLAKLLKRAIDVDDTAKGLLALSHLGQLEGLTPAAMVKMFEKEDAFCTFAGERDRSWSSNCHVLLALLQDDFRQSYASQIRKTVDFIIEFWWKSDGLPRDKWHLSHFYPAMLMVQALVAFLRSLEGDHTYVPADQDLVLKVSICLFQACIRTLHEQGPDGSWGNSADDTAFAVLTLAEARQLWIFKDFQSQLQSAFDHGIAYLDIYGVRTLSSSWTSKTKYSVKFVSEAYVLAAYCVSQPIETFEGVGRSLLVNSDVPQIGQYASLLKRTKLFSSLPEWHVLASLVESSLFIPLLRARQLDIFTRDDYNHFSKGSYLNLIPFTWIGCNNLLKVYVPTNFLFDMMVMSLIGFQTDEFFEAFVTPAFLDNPDSLHSMINYVVSSTLGKESETSKVVLSPNISDIRLEYHEICETFLRLSTHVLHHDRVYKASAVDRKNLEFELRNFLLGHATQIKDNTAFASQVEDAGHLYKTEERFFHWVRTTSADHIACAYSFAWACCWVSQTMGNGMEMFATPTEKHLAAAMIRHASTMCRMHNDIGSIPRDSSELNVNCIHFPEFHSMATNDPAAKKQALTTMAEYEKSCYEYSLRLLEKEVLRAYPDDQEAAFSRSKLRIVQLFGNVTCLYDQLYVLKDLSSKIGSHQAA
ncbi:hypothetical protein COCCADRAFT_10099 [Bipolaris zeicola 26-R-13]|uniref:Ent-kaurene synthase n=1 Tax=Cochliobolus carbonum (strain 26-R-13) TaxID=930089 RepID=W6XX06_COCC2|nr:uncharacterized protein COCCADRAFT_10099 [Bipolaris zeicola 26-R-13]EUC27264.1 hypothetical protein COCCADRAFT_10099 [Bipolaris zeicola 26-R-13]